MEKREGKNKKGKGKETGEGKIHILLKKSILKFHITGKSFIGAWVVFSKSGKNVYPLTYYYFPLIQCVLQLMLRLVWEEQGRIQSKKYV